MRYTLPAELHCHSNTKEIGFRLLPYLQDSLQTVEEIVLTCQKRGVKILAITDHDSLLGYHMAKHFIETNKIKMLLIPACEVTTKKGHILAYGITKEIPRKLSARETIKLIHAQNGLAVAAHPFTFPFALGKKVFNLPIDAVEGFNGPTPSFLNFHSHSLAMKHHLPSIAGSDSHEPESLCYGITRFSSSVKTVEDFLQALKVGNFSIEFTPTNNLSSALNHLKVLLTNILTNTRPNTQPIPLHVSNQENSLNH
ncbi:MAG: PHP domain protein [Candidatus Collierbacteria bacterium GW2011_GWE1_46_18]|uniref:PHP domain protein n=1 Tax=Candidatus Collierbacteria bacterium GW2011_GWE1_46_18 TaxID=1618399 RepID=A0A0G1PC15_9BACT|nr:MAG: PHP domain protein [Candidatus Collierbacteria bacterium GW2011_GWE1_46_18]